MAFGYRADKEAAADLKQIFGNTVTEVTFWDFDYPEHEDTHWEEIVGTLADGTEVSKQPGDADWMKLEDIADAYGDTVKFFIYL